MSTAEPPPELRDVDGWHWVIVRSHVVVRLWRADRYEFIWMHDWDDFPEVYVGPALSSVEVKVLQTELQVARDAIRWRPIAEAPDRGAVLHLYVPGHKFGPEFQVISTLEMYPSATHWLPLRPAP